jgi:hypothetical protein
MASSHWVGLELCVNKLVPPWSLVTLTHFSYLLCGFLFLVELTYFLKYLFLQGGGERDENWDVLACVQINWTDIVGNCAKISTDFLLTIHLSVRWSAYSNAIHYQQVPSSIVDPRAENWWEVFSRALISLSTNIGFVESSGIYWWWWSCLLDRWRSWCW